MDKKIPVSWFILIYWVVVTGFFVVFSVVILKEHFKGTHEDILALSFITYVVLIILPLVVWLASGLLPRLQEFSLGDVHFQFRRMRERIEEQENKVHQITGTQQSTLHSLASLVITDPLRSPKYKEYVDNRVKKDKKIIVACQPYTEQRLLCAIITKLLFRAAQRNPVLDIEMVKPKYNFGGAGLQFIALTRGDIDIYPAYTYQGFENAFATSLVEFPSLASLSPEKAIKLLNDIYDAPPNELSWICHLGFHDNWEIAIPNKLADKKEISKISDLKKLGRGLKMACERDFFDRPNGFNLLKASEPEGYGLPFQEIKFYPHDEVYRAMDKEGFDMVDAFTTDPQIQPPSDYTILIDDKKRFGLYYASVVIRKDLDQVCPGVRKTLELLEDRISEDMMRNLLTKANSVPFDESEEAHIANVEKIASEFITGLEIL